LPGLSAFVGRTGDESAVSHRAERRLAPLRVSPQRAAERKRFARCRNVWCEPPGHIAMVMTEAAAPKAMRGLPGATVLQILPALEETPAARNAVDLAVALLRSGARVIVAAEDGPLNSELQGLGGEWVRLVTETTNPLSITRNARTIANLVSTERVDLVHALGVGASRSAAALKKRAGVWLVHSYAAEDLKRDSRDKSYSRALIAGDRVIVPSHYVADQVMARHQVPREKLAVIPRRVDGARFDPPAISPERAMVLRRGWKIGRGQRMILVPGRIDPAKGQLTLVETARILTNGGLRGVVFVLAGDNRQHFDYAKKIAEQAEAHGVAHLIRQIGVCSDMAGAYLATDFVAVPQVEPPAFPLAAAEAMAMARPVIATHVGAIPEIVQAPPHVLESGRTGWLAEPDDAVSLARALAAALATEAASYNAIGTRARRLASQYFMPSRTSAAALNLYASLFEGRG
jgi:glycosyltransferase involved in cell wall biosynthesis